MKPTVRQAVPEDAYAITLRKEDAREVSGEWRADTAASIAAHGGVTFVAPDGALLLIGGAPNNNGLCGPWMLASPEARRYGSFILRAARRVTAGLREQAAAGVMVFNYIPKDSWRNRAFVQRLGFRILPSPGPGYDLFYLPNPHV